MAGIDCDTLRAMEPDYHDVYHGRSQGLGPSLESIDRLLRNNIENPPCANCADSHEARMGTWWFDFTDGIARRVANDVINDAILITAGPILGPIYAVYGPGPVEVFERPETIRGELGYDLGPAVEVIAGGIAGATRGLSHAARGLTTDQAANLSRFVKKLPRGAGEPSIRDLPSGGKAFQAEVPGRVTGSKAIYEKQVDASGRTIQYTKTTYDPAGNIVHVKDKITEAVFP
jgi:hypothetical protein